MFYHRKVAGLPQKSSKQTVVAPYRPVRLVGTNGDTWAETRLSAAAGARAAGRCAAVTRCNRNRTVRRFYNVLVVRFFS